MAEQSEWVSLGEAAKIMGVHPTTVRNWADQGELPFRRTPGKHRRFQRSVLEQWAKKKRGDKPPTSSASPQVLAEYALGHTRFGVDESQLQSMAWYERFDEENRKKMRHLGRRLLEALVQHLEDKLPEEEEFSEAHKVGKEYAEQLKIAKLNLGQAVRGFIYFNGFLVESVVHMMAPTLSSSPSEWSDLFQQINAFTGEVLVTLISHYQKEMES